MAIVFLFYDRLYVFEIREGNYTEMPRIATACILLFVAAGIDFLDGFLARVLKAQSEIGKELDSLADMITFGVVPGLMMFQLMARAFTRSADAFSSPVALHALGFLLTAFAALRLARFNTTESRPGFTGLPTPAMALLVASLPMIALTDTTGIGAQLDNKWVLIGITVLVSLLMVSSIPLLSLKIRSLKFSEYPWQIGGFLSGWALFFLCIFVLNLGWLTIPICFIYYLILSLVHAQMGNQDPKTV